MDAGSLPIALILFLAGVLTILLPCILPLIPIVLGVSVTGRSRMRPIWIVLGMLVSFVGFTFLLQVLLRRFPMAADILHVATFQVLFLFGVGFLTGRRSFRLIAALLSGFFFAHRGLDGVLLASILGIAAMEAGGWVAPRIQQFGSDVQRHVREELRPENPLVPFFIGLTLGLVWVPCAGPALGFAYTLVRDDPGPRAAFLLSMYGLGTALPLLLIAYGGQAAVQTVKRLNAVSGRIKQAAGVLLILTAIGLQLRLFELLQLWLLEHTRFGDLGTRLERTLFSEEENGGTLGTMMLPRIVRAPELKGLGPWHNSPPLTLAELKGKVVLVDFWTYSCINCIRTLPFMRGYAEKYKDQPFVVLGIHAPEFAFERDPKNVADAIKRYNLPYPVAQDNEFQTWRAFANRYWPAKYLIDAEGYIRYTHFGEGEYEETDQAIQALLKEAGAEMVEGPMIPVAEEAAGLPRSPETYLGERSWPALANAQGRPTGEVIAYEPPTSLPLHRFALVGSWQLVEGERQVLQSPEGEIRMRWMGGEINLVLGVEGEGASATAQVFIDDAIVQTITIDHDDLYPLFRGVYGEHDLTLRVRGAGVSAYAFTFGS